MRKQKLINSTGLKASESSLSCRLATNQKMSIKLTIFQQAENIMKGINTVSSSRFLILNQ